MPYAPLLAMLLWAAGVDVRTRRIPNALVLIILLTGLLLSFTPWGTLAPSRSLLGILAGGLLVLPLFMLRALGGGDVKLLAGVGAWVGPVAAFKIVLAAAVVAMLLVLIQSLLRRQLLLLTRNTLLLAADALHHRRLDPEPIGQTAHACRSTGAPLPYALAVLLATLLVLGQGGRL